MGKLVPGLAALLDGLPDGFNFNPEDPKLISFLLKYLAEIPLPAELFLEADVYATEPWNLKKPYFYNGEGLYFSQRHKLASGAGAAAGKRVKRTTKSGLWSMNRTTSIFSLDEDEDEESMSKKVVGYKTTFTFHQGKKRNQAIKTDWIMHEFTLQSPDDEHRQFEPIALCKIYNKVDIRVPAGNGNGNGNTDSQSRSSKRRRLNQEKINSSNDAGCSSSSCRLYQIDQEEVVPAKISTSGTPESLEMAYPPVNGNGNGNTDSESRSSKRRRLNQEIINSSNDAGCSSSSQIDQEEVVPAKISTSGTPESLEMAYPPVNGNGNGNTDSESRSSKRRRLNQEINNSSNDAGCSSSSQIDQEAKVSTSGTPESLEMAYPRAVDMPTTSTCKIIVDEPHLDEYVKSLEKLLECPDEELPEAPVNAKEDDEGVPFLDHIRKSYLDEIKALGSSEFDAVSAAAMGVDQFLLSYDALGNPL